MYQRAGVESVGRPVYLERPRGGAELLGWPDQAEASYRRHLEANALAWSERSNLTALDLSIADGPADGYAGLVDSDGGPVPATSFAAGSSLLADSVGLIRAYDVLPRVRDKVGFFNEAYRVLAHAGVLLTLTPSSDGRGAFQDPAHVAYYNEHSFWYFTDDELRRFVPEITCRFQAAELVTFYPSDWHEEHHILYVQATLIAIKRGSRQGGRLAV
jgi:SAM-dependent methyltransferase